MAPGTDSARRRDPGAVAADVRAMSVRRPHDVRAVSVPGGRPWPVPH
ncbi:hypothetical protein KPATCC21470_2950 [Kitasatospora purpeofusca]